MATPVRACPKCAAEIRSEWRSCPFCHERLPTSNSEIPTVAMHPHRTPSSTDEGRFPVGMLLGERYKVLGLLGRGGMGEVYRAHDLKLEQQVALKFLPAIAARDSRLIERFRAEVRIARQISHRNVCRVYDLGEIDGAPFISMEYVDGEDLGSLLRRIGRLPGDKAIEFARRLCAGLAAAHDKGVLHRDLKPANIMIDGRGQVLIMDFGLAAAADSVAGRDIRSGTPAYMAPEQKEGRDVTVRSDIYSLGLVLAEMFTGHKASEDHKLSTTVKDINPAVEKAIQRCLDPNPRNRPATALDLARALPGGDPLAEALAAGDTPSPEMVAASEDTGALSVRAAVACMFLIVAGLAASVFWGSRSHFVNLTPMPYSPDVLTQKSHELIAHFGYADPPTDETYGFDADIDYAAWAEQNLQPEEYRMQFAKGQPAALYFYYLQGPQYLVPEVSGVAGSGFSRTYPPRVPGSIDVWLDPQGRLMMFQAVPHREMSPPTNPLDWKGLFQAAGLDPALWTPADPQEIPQVGFDTRAAWTGTYPSSPKMPMRIEAAEWKGRLVYFEMFGPWRHALPGIPSTGLSIPALLVIAIAGASLFALINLRTGRGDLIGAVRLAAFVLVSSFISGVLQTHHPATLGELGALSLRLAISCLLAAIVWALYMALEPYVRRRWPQVLIGWTRALAGNLRDPLVAGHILAGVTAGIGIGLIPSAAYSFRFSPLSTIPSSLQPVGTIANWFGDVSLPPALALGVFFLFLLLKLAFRLTWLAAAAVVAIITAIAFVGGGWVAALAALLMATTSMVVAIRFGMLAFAVTIILQSAPSRYPLTGNFSAWFATAGWMEVALVLGVSLWCFRNALGGRRLWKGDLLES